MKPILIFLLLILPAVLFAQEELQLQGIIVDSENRPIPDVYVINYRSSDKNVTRNNGVFDILVLPGDSIIISHVSYFRKMITVHQLLVNPTIQLEIDTINILPITVSPNQLTDSEKAAENIKSIEFDFRPNTEDISTEKQRMDELIKTENSVERAAASSLNFVTFSPSEYFNKWSAKRKQKKKSKEFYSTTKKEINEKKKNKDKK